MTDEEKAEDYVVCNHCEKYMLGKCHSKKCVKLYLDGLAEGRKEGFDAGYKKATERAYERQQDLTNTYINDGEKIKQLEKEIDYYKSRESHWDEIEEDAKKIAEENAEFEKQLEEKSDTNHIIVEQLADKEIEIAELKAQIEKMKLDQKTAFDKGMKHLAKELKEYDRINGAWTDYFEHTVNKVLKWELEKKGRTEWEVAE